MSTDGQNSSAGDYHLTDYTSTLPDECLSSILQNLDNHDDRSNSSLVCHRWLTIEAQTRRRLKLHAHPDVLPSIFARFVSITDLSIIGRQGPKVNLHRTNLIVPSLDCNNLTRLTLSNCKIPASAVEALSEKCARLEEIHLERVEMGMTIPSFADSSSLKVIGLKHIRFSAPFLVRLIKASKSLKTLHSCRSGQAGTLLECLSDTVTEIRLEQVVVNDIDMGLISTRCPNLEILCLVNFFGDCSDAGIAMVANKCKSLRKLHIDDFWLRGKNGSILQYIRDEGLIDVANNCPNLEELMLDSVGVTRLSLEMVFSKCVKLETLTLSGIKRVKDVELMCIASECHSLKKLWIEFCPVTDKGIQALAIGCPELAQVMFRECWKSTLKGSQMLKASRPSLDVDFDVVGRGRRNRPLGYLSYLRECGGV